MSKLIKWDPFKELADFQNRLTTLLSDEPSKEGGALFGQADWAPAIDVSEDDEEYLLTADLPEVKKDEVKVKVEDGMLSISGERSHEVEKKDKKKKFHRIERSYGKYLRSFRVPDDVAAEQIHADFNDGVLKVHLPKCAEKKPNTHEVTVS